MFWCSDDTKSRHKVWYFQTLWWCKCDNMYQCYTEYLNAAVPSVILKIFSWASGNWKLYPFQSNLPIFADIFITSTPLNNIAIKKYFYSATMWNSGGVPKYDTRRVASRLLDQSNNANYSIWRFKQSECHAPQIYHGLHHCILWCKTWVKIIGMGVMLWSRITISTKWTTWFNFVEIVIWRSSIGRVWHNKKWVNLIGMDII